MVKARIVHLLRTPASVAALALALSACGPDAGQARICERVLHALTLPNTKPEIIERSRARGTDAGVSLVYRATAGADAGRRRTLTCEFAASGLDQKRLRLVRVLGESGKPLSTLSMILLRRRLSLE